MSDSIRNIKTLFEYFNAGMYISFGIFIVCTVYIWIAEKNKKIRDFFTWYTIAIFAVIWNPLAIKILNKFINFSSLYRLYYMLPLYVTIAVAFTKFIENRKNKIVKTISIICMVGFVCFFNEQNVFMSPIYPTYQYNNYYKLPDETIRVANTIYNDDTYERKMAIVPYGMSSQIQQIYPSIELLYTRIVTSLKDENGNPLPTDSEDPAGYEPIERMNAGDTKYLAELCDDKAINYVVLSKDLEMQEPLEDYHFRVLEETDENIIYIKEK